MLTTFEMSAATLEHGREATTALQARRFSQGFVTGFERTLNGTQRTD